MKRGSLITILCILILIGLTFVISGELTGEVITGEATTQTFSANISVTGSFPLLTILSPENKTYTENNSILINYTVANQDTIWYNLDNSNNITINSSLIINVSEGSHTLYLYANGSSGDTTERSVSFNVNTSANASVQESPAPSGGGGGSSRESEMLQEHFTIDKEEITVSLKQGEVKTEKIKLQNTGKVGIYIRISILDINEFIKVSEKEFYLEKEESKDVFLDILARDETVPELYQGMLLIESREIKKELPVAIEVESKEKHFDISLEIEDEFKQIIAGEEVKANIELLNHGEEKPINITMEYYLRNQEGETIISSEEIISVNIRKKLTKVFPIPENFKPGDYVIYVKATHNKVVSSSSEWFSVEEFIPTVSPLRKILNFYNKYNLLIIFLLLTLIVLIIYKRIKNIMNIYEKLKRI